MVCVLVLAVALLGGCGSSRQSEAFVDGLEACGTEPKSEFAVHSVGMSAESSDVAIARGYADKWPRKLREDIFEGCMAGLALVPSRFPPSSPLARDIWGRNFIVISVTEGGDEEPPVGRSSTVRFTFSSEQHHDVSWMASCNGHGGDVQITATRVKVDGFGSTLIGCDPERQEEDEWLTRFMQADPEWSLEGELLQLRSDDATMDLKGSADPNSCPVSPDGGRIDLGNSGRYGCEAALNLLVLYAEGKERYMQGWKCRDEESRNGRARVLCRHGKRWFALYGVDPDHLGMSPN